jgi:hypothetical protein
MPLPSVRRRRIRLSPQPSQQPLPDAPERLSRGGSLARYPSEPTPERERGEEKIPDGTTSLLLKIGAFLYV